MFVIVGNSSEGKLIRDIETISQNLLFVSRINVVECGNTVASKSVRCEVSICQSKITLIGILFCILQFEFDALSACGLGELYCVVLDIETGVSVMSVDVLKAVGLPLMSFDQVSETVIE